MWVERNSWSLLCTARLIWQVLICTLGLVRSPEGAHDLAGNWIDSFPLSRRKLVLCGVEHCIQQFRRLEMMHVLDPSSQMIHQKLFTACVT
jgi:hypothetical protein